MEGQFHRLWRLRWTEPPSSLLVGGIVEGEAPRRVCYNGE